MYLFKVVFKKWQILYFIERDIKDLEQKINFLTIKSIEILGKQSSRDENIFAEIPVFDN